MLRRLLFSPPVVLRHCASKHRIYCSNASERIKENIVRETEISRAHLTPEIALHLITPKCRLFHEAITVETTKVFSNDPFWGFYWPGGQALSRYILDNQELVAGKTVLDVGSGCGASSLAAVMSGAKSVMANDIDEAAACALLLNAQLNNVPLAKLDVCCENLIGSSAPVNADLVLLGDVFYDETFAAELLPWLQHLHDAGKQILVGDPGRHGLTAGRLSFMQKLTTYELTENCCIENNGFKYVSVWRFKRRREQTSFDG